MNSKGTIYRKADLHIHTPASSCYSDKSVTAVQIVEEALSKGLEIIAITDHNDIASIEKVRTEAKNKGLIVFLGIEISTQEAHLLALFEPDYSIETLNEFLPSIGILKEHRGKKEAMAGSFEAVLDKVTEFGGIAIAAHANGDSGILHSSKKGAYKQKVCKNPDLCALELSRQDYIEDFMSGKVPNYPAKACVCCSDAHSLAEIGQRCTYLKLDVVSINGLKLALTDYQVRVRFPWNSIVSTHPRIRRITVDQGFFKDVVFNLNPNLTCLVGGTGTGKSTIIEFLRYCFDDLSPFKEIATDSYEKVEKLIGAGGTISVEYTSENGEDVIISREVNDPMYRDEETVLIKDKDDLDVLMPSKPVFFSQGEIARIAMNPIAQLELIDKYIDISTENRLEQELTSALASNASVLTEIRSNRIFLEQELNDPENGKLAIEKERDRLQEQLKNPIFAEFPKWELEGRFIKQTVEGIDKAHKAIKESLINVNIEEYFPIKLDNASPNYPKLQSMNQIPDALSSVISELIDQLDADVLKIGLEANKIYSEWELLFTKRKQEYEQFLAQLGAEDVNKAQKRLRALNERLSELAEIEAKVKSFSEREKKVWEERGKLLDQLKKVRHDRMSKRVAKANEWERRLNNKIKIALEVNKDMSEYLPELRTLTTGSNAHKASVVQIAIAIEPLDLVRAFLNNDSKFISDHSKADKDDIQRILDFLKYKDLKELLKLESVPISDLPKISYEVEPGKYKLINELATGTKSIVIVSIAMIEGNSPLVIDQPEDSLNTEFIYTQIVSRLREEKETRQFLFASHNSNIVVSGETDLAHILTATSDQGTIKSSGGIDHPDTNKLMLLHLEGGPDAFNLRAKKYGQP